MQRQKLALTPLDHLTPRRYPVNLLYFPRSNTDITSIASKLKTSLRRTFDALPILSGTVQSDQDKQRQEGALCVDAPWMDVDDIFVVNDLTSCEDLVYDDLKREHFPMTTTERYDFRSVMYANGGGMKTLPAPVMMAQVNFIRGGMVLAQCFHHSFMDGLGGANVTSVWAAFCRGEDGGKLVTESMWDRSRLMQGDEDVGLGSIGEYVEYPKNVLTTFPAAGSKVGLKQMVGERKASHPQHALQANKESENQRTTQPKENKREKEVDGEIFFFSHARLAALKVAVSAALPRQDPTSATATPTAMPLREAGQIPPQTPSQPNISSVADNVSHNASFSSQPYISTNDALSALLFTCITVARDTTTTLSSSIATASAPKISHHPNLPRTIPLGLTVSGRRLLTPPLPKTYIGNSTLFCHLNISLPYPHPSPKANHSMPTSAMRATPRSDPHHHPTGPPTPAITPDIPTIASLAYRIRTRLLELDEDYVRGLIGALHRVSDLASVMPACLLSGAVPGVGAPILAQRQDDGDLLSTRGADKLAAGREEGEVSSWAFMISPWTTQGFYTMDWGAELLGGREGLVSGDDRKEVRDGGGAGRASVRMGRCERVRIPKVRWEAMDGICIVLPMLEGGEEEGGLEVMVGLERGVMGRLKGMEEWIEWAERRCD